MRNRWSMRVLSLLLVEQGDRVSAMAINPAAVVQRMHNRTLDSFHPRAALQEFCRFMGIAAKPPGVYKI